MGGPDMAPQTPQTFGAPGMNPGAPLSPSPTRSGGAPAKPWHPSIFRQALSASRAILSGQIRASPLVLVHDLLQRPATDGTEASHRIADRKDGVRVHAGRQAQRGLGLLLEEEVARRQGGSQPESARR